MKLKNYTKSFNDDIESDFRNAQIPYQLMFRKEYDEFTRVLEDKYGLSETAKLDLLSSSRRVFNYSHLDRPNWTGHVVLSQVFAGRKLFLRCRDSDSDRLFVIDGKFAARAIDFFGGGRCVMFLQDLSFILVDHFSYNVIYDGERNTFYEHADKLLQDFYKKIDDDA